jgi:hypothetical protein
MTTSDNVAFEDIFAEVFGEAFELLVARQHKYGPDNIERLGVHGVLSRLAHDKVERVMRALNGTVVHGRIVLTIDPSGEAGDTFEDALLDIANYALIALVLRRGRWGAPTRRELEQPSAHLALVENHIVECPSCGTTFTEALGTMLADHEVVTSDERTLEDVA